MILYGGAVTLNSMLAYVAFNMDKVLLGRFWGAGPLGLYGRAYQLINLPTESLNSTLGLVAFPALSRVQDEPARLRRYFLKGYNLFLSLILPITVACVLFAEDIIRVFLGAQWHEAVQCFRLLAPTILTFALVNPFAWLLQATGRATRALKISIVVTPLVILGYAIGLPHGPDGVAAGFSLSMSFVVVPAILWARHGTEITNRDLFKAVGGPVLSILLAALAMVAALPLLGTVYPVLLRLGLKAVALFGIYGALLVFVVNPRAGYLKLLQEAGLWPGRPTSRQTVPGD
jgi:PST family polysaccharide transporter